MIQIEFKGKKSQSYERTITTKWRVNQAPEWLLLNFGLLWKSVTSVQPLLPRFLWFCDSRTWRKEETREQAQEDEEDGERKSDLGEKKRISGEIKVKSTLDDHSEMRLCRRRTAKLTGLDAHGHKNTHVHTHHQKHTKAR